MNLEPCPNKPNCVSTQSQSKQHKIDPYKYTKDLTLVTQLVKNAILSQPRTKLVKESPTHLKFEFTSKLFRFVDDVDLVFDDKSKTIHFRSASRVGYSDLGANRERMESLRKLLSGNI